MKKYTKKQWNDVRVYNSWDISVVSGSCGTITYLPQTTYRAGQWCVRLKGQPAYTVSIYDFNGTHRQRAEAALLKAQAWAANQRTYEIRSWERDVWGGWHPEGTMERAMSAAKAKNEGEKAK